MDNIYREELLEIYKNPSHKGTLKVSSSSVHKENTMCGDNIDLQVQVTDGIIKDAKFSGNACAVSVISSDLLLDHIIGKSVKEVEKLEKEDLLKILNLNLSTSRVKCATLVLTALKDALKKMENVTEITPETYTKDSNLGDLVTKHSEVVEILMDYGLHCVGCALSAFDTLEQGAKAHGLSDEEITELVERINEVITHGE